MAQYSAAVQSLLTRIDNLKAQIEALRPIKPELISRIFQKYRLEWNYNSNSIEGNSLSYGETVAFIMEGLTAKGKPLKDHLDIKGHNQAIDFLLDMQKQGSELMERDIRGLHEMILVEPYQTRAQTADGQATTKTIQLGVYKTSANHVVTKTGETHYYASPEETPALMQELMAWYRENLPTMHPLVLSTLFHHRFVNIHPFDDGNGRMSRLLSNLILMQAGLPPVVVRQDQKGEYYGVLSQADAGIIDPLLEYFAVLLIRSLEIYLKGALGEDISEPDDLDKEIALFTASFDEDILTRQVMSRELLAQYLTESIIPLFSSMISYGKKLDNLFHNKYIYARREFSPNNGVDYDLPEEIIFEEWLNAPNGFKPVFIEDFFRPQEGTPIIEFFYVWSDFKARPDIQPVVLAVTVTFDTYDYNIRIDGEDEETDIIKFYPKQLTKDEIQSRTALGIRQIMNEIKVKLAAPPAPAPSNLAPPTYADDDNDLPF